MHACTHIHTHTHIFLQITGKRQPESPLQTPNLLARDLAWIFHSPGLWEISILFIHHPVSGALLAVQTKIVSFHRVPFGRKLLCKSYTESVGDLCSAFMKKSVYINFLEICTIFSKTCPWEFSVLGFNVFAFHSVSFYFTIDILGFSSVSCRIWHPLCSWC